jgi:shikimate kinase
MSASHILYIIGFMGSGKTTAGKKVASSLGWAFIDLDKKIEEHSGMTISEIFREYGENHFRIAEAEVLRSVCPDMNTVISTGGGTPCYGNNMEFMLETGLTIYLKMTPQQLAGRLSSSKDERPLIRNLNGETLLSYIEEKLALREIWYEKSAIIAEGSDLDVAALISRVKSHLTAGE